MMRLEVDEVSEIAEVDINISPRPPRNILPPRDVYR